MHLGLLKDLLMSFDDQYTAGDSLRKNQHLSKLLHRPLYYILLRFSCGMWIFFQMKSYIWLQTADGSIQQVEEEVAMFCPMICREILQTGMGSSKNYAISLPQRVNPAILGLILDYCRFHQVPGRSNKVSISLNLV